MEGTRNDLCSEGSREKRLRSLSPADRTLFLSIADAESGDKVSIVQRLGTLKTRAGLWCALEALYRYQVHTGFVLIDPLKMGRERIRKIPNPRTNVTTILQWNPEREWRKDHRLLIDRGIIVEAAPSRLRHHDQTGKPCYLCKQNIDVMNPGEILLEVLLCDEQFYAGVNFASICDNHYTVMHSMHRDQTYRSVIPSLMIDFIDVTESVFRIVYNGRAGASIKAHEHFQATTEPFPIESIRVGSQDTVAACADCQISNPSYPVPVWIVEGEDRRQVETVCDKMIRRWHGLDEKHTENLIVVRCGKRYRFFIILREETRLTGPGKHGVMASFETGGVLVLSRTADESETFQKADSGVVNTLLQAIAPDKDRIDAFRLWVEKEGVGAES